MPVTSNSVDMLGADGVWRKMGMEVALRNRGNRGTKLYKKMRCVECHGEVVLMDVSVTGTEAHVEHKVSFAGCSLCEKWDGKTRRRNPSPILN
jgi:hypothetical protein